MTDQITVFEETRLNADWTFDTFATGRANDLASAAAMQVAMHPEDSYNPLFIYGDVGVGKTHLLHAIGNTIYAGNPGLNVRYVRSEDFFTDVVNAYQQDTRSEFKYYYGSLDLLLMTSLRKDIKMLGAAIGDIVGSVYEFNNYRAKDFQPFFRSDTFFTDDTVCTIAIADALVNHIDPAISLRTWGRRYEKNGGWGARFAQWLGSDDEGPYNSYGNGAGMRVSPAGFLARSADEAVALSDLVTAVTHNHPQGMRGAAATSVAIFLARNSVSAEAIRADIVKRFGYDMSMSVDEIRPWYKYNERALDTVPQALTCALEACSYEDAIRNSISIGGDSDTIAAIAGGLAEALFGIPEDIARIGWDKIPGDMQKTLTGLYAMAELRSKTPCSPSITAVLGNIVTQDDCDGLVNSANENLRAGSGVCGAIHSAAGPRLEEFSQKLAPLALGAAVTTPGFSLKQKAVIHTRGPKYLFDPDPAANLALSVTNSLLAADNVELQRIAVPAISTGVYGYPPEEAVPILVNAAQKTGARLHHVKEIRFVAATEEMLTLFQAALRGAHSE